MKTYSIGGTKAIVACDAALNSLTSAYKQNKNINSYYDLKIKLKKISLYFFIILSHLHCI